MDFVFLNFKTSAKEYVDRKLRAALAAESGGEIDEAALSRSVAAAVAHPERPAPQIAAESEFFEVDAKQRKLIDVAERCAFQELATAAPLLDGEEIEEDFFSYLTAPWNGIPAFTGALRRRTNMAEILYLFNLVRIDNGNLAHLSPPEPEVPPPVLRGMSFEITGALIRKLLQGAATKVASAGFSKLGTVLINLALKELFGLDDTQRLIDEVARIIKDEIESNEVAKIQGTIDGTLLFLTGEYKHAKDKADLDDPTSRRALLSDLKAYSNRFYTEVIGTLKQEKYAVRGLKTFAFGATVHLLITQEMALVDPDYLDPNKSSYLLTLRDNAATYRQHVDHWYHKAMGDRSGQMGVYTTTFVDCGGGASCVHKTQWRWRDNGTGKTAGPFSGTKNPKKSASDVANESLNRYRQGVLTEYDKNLGSPKAGFLVDVVPLEKYTFPKPA